MKKATTFFIISTALLASVFAFAYSGALNFNFADETSSAETQETQQIVVQGESMVSPPPNILLGLNYSVFSATPNWVNHSILPFPMDLFPM